MDNLYEWLHHRWYNRAKDRARQDARYSEIEDELRTKHGTLLWSGKEELWKEWDNIFDRINKRPLYLRIIRFFEHKQLTLRHLRRRARFARQRIKQGYSSGDVWSLDYYLNRVIIGGMTELRENLHGFPAELLPDPVDNSDKEESENASALWAAILTGIIEGFEAAQAIVELSGSEDFADLQAVFDLGFDLFHDYYFHLWD